MLFFSLTAAAGERPDALYESLISRIASGDKDALGALYENINTAH